jgi:hypothetical protein
MIKYITMEEGLNLKKHIPMIMGCEKCGKKTKHTHKETEKLHIYKCSQCNNVKWDRKSKKDMKTIKLTEKDLTNIVKKIVNESKPKVSTSFVPAERNVGKKIDYVPPTEKTVSIYDKDMMRKEITQKVVDRIMKFGDMYTKKLIELNKKFPIKKDRFEQY